MKYGILFAALFGLYGCNSCSQDWSHLKSETIGIKRVIILYSATGEPIRKWTTNSTVEDQGGSFRFMYNGKAVTIAGTVTMEEE